MAFQNTLQMGRESRKQIKAQVTNEVRNKYFKIIEGKNEEISQLVQRGLKIQRWNEELVAENIKLKEQLEKYEDWNRRLQEFMDMDPDSREEVITQYRTSKELNDRFSNILNMYEKMFGMFQNIISESTNEQFIFILHETVQR